MSEEKFLDVFKKEDFRKWLSKNSLKEKKVGLILHKKHTGKGSPSHRELMEEAICYGWIDTTIKRIDEDKFIRFFSKRNKNSSWSYNTLSYAEQLIKDKRMCEQGLIAYEEGKKKLPLDHGIPKDPEMPEEMKKALVREKLLQEFNKLSPSVKRMHLRWLIRAKQQQTKDKRIKLIIEELKRKISKK